MRVEIGVGGGGGNLWEEQPGEMEGGGRWRVERGKE
jgi:hypothetical protein